MSLASEFDFEDLLARATAWAKEQENTLSSDGVPLQTELLEIAKRIGIAHPDRVRLRIVDAMPQPDDLDLRAAALEAGLLGPSTAGLTIGYGIFIRSDVRGDRRLTTHELAHVAQYERLGGIEPFLRVYLSECLIYGYYDAPLEEEARRIENEFGGEIA